MRILVIWFKMEFVIFFHHKIWILKNVDVLHFSRWNKYFILQKLIKYLYDTELRVCLSTESIGE